jgi:uncharacterized SAM-binding protein YcdF (DUF218 family)
MSDVEGGELSGLVIGHGFKRRHAVSRGRSCNVSGPCPRSVDTRPESQAVELEKPGINLVGEAEYNREILIHEGVPGTAVRVLPRTIVNTEPEVQEVARQMRQTEKSRAIIVTSPQHTRCVRTLWIQAYREQSGCSNSCRALNAWAELPLRRHSN